MTQPPLRKTITLTRSPPFLAVEERPEDRQEHRNAAVIMALLTAAALSYPPVPAAFAVVPAIGGGFLVYALHAWLVHDDLYEAGDQR